MQKTEQHVPTWVGLRWRVLAAAVTGGGRVGVEGVVGGLWGWHN